MATGMTGAFRTVENAGLSDRLHGWEQFLQSRILGVQILADAKRSFLSEARISDFGALSVTRYEVTPQTMARTSRMVTDGDGAYCMTIVESGSIVARRDGGGVMLHPGEALVLSAAKASAFHMIEPTVFWGVKLVDPERLPFEMLRRRSRDMEIHAGRDIEILTAYCQLIDQLPHGSRSDAVARVITDHLCDFVANSIDAAIA
jgi:hypothetical protein